MKIAQISSVYLSIPPKTHGGTERIDKAAADLWGIPLAELEQVQRALKKA